jgi:hypothetical protein
MQSSRKQVVIVLIGAGFSPYVKVTEMAGL